MKDPTGFSAEKGGGQIEPIDRMLVALIVFFTVVVIGVSLLNPTDGQTFQLLSGLLAGAMGAFLARVKPSKVEAPPGSTTVTKVDQVIKSPAPLEANG